MLDFYFFILWLTDWTRIRLNQEAANAILSLAKPLESRFKSESSFRGSQILIYKLYCENIQGQFPRKYHFRSDALQTVTCDQSLRRPRISKYESGPKMRLWLELVFKMVSNHLARSLRLSWVFLYCLVWIHPFYRLKSRLFHAQILEVIIVYLR